MIDLAWAAPDEEPPLPEIAVETPDGLVSLRRMEDYLDHADYHYAPFEDHFGRGPFAALCGTTSHHMAFYVRLRDFLCMPVHRCPTCEDLAIASFAAAAAAVRELLA